MIWRNGWHDDGIKTPHEGVVPPLDEEEDDVKMPNVMSRVAGPVAVPAYSEGAAPAHPRSEGTINPALRVFKVPPTDISINAYRMVTIQPTTTGINPMEFIIPALDDYVDLGRSYFTMELRLKKVTMGTWWPMKNCGPLTIWPIPSSNKLTCS